MDMDTNDTSATSASISANTNTNTNTNTSSNDNKHDDTSSNSKSRPNAKKLNFASRKNMSKSKSVASITTSTTLTPLRFTYGLRHPRPHRNCHHHYNTQKQQKQCQVKAKLRRSARLKNSTGGTSTASAAATVVSASTTNNNNVDTNSNSKSENSWFVSPPPTASITKIADSASAGNSNSMASTNGKVNVNENDPYYSVSNISTLTQSTTSASVNASGSVSGLSCSCYIADTVDTKNSNPYYYDQDHTGQENDHKHEEDDIPTDCEHLDEIEVVKKIGLGEGSKEMQLNTKIDKLGVPNDYYLRHQTRHSHQDKHKHNHQCQKQLLNHNTNEKGPNNKLKTLSTARTRSSTNTRKRSWALSSSSSSKLSTLSTRLSSRIVLSKNKTKTKDKIKKWTHSNCKKYKSSSGLFITPPHLLSSQKQSLMILTTSTSPSSSFNYSNKNLLVGISTVDNGAGNENDDNTKNTIIAKNTKKKLTSTNDKQKHRYHLRSFHQNECHENDHEKRHQTYSDGDSHDDNTEEEKEEEMQPQVNVIDTYIDTEDKNRFIELETLSNLIVATTSQPNQHMHQHHRTCSNPIIQCVFQQPLPACRYSYDSIVTSHNFMSNYGSLYYQSLLDREEKQSMDSKKRLEDYYKQSTSTDVATVTSSNISSSSLNVEEGGKGQKQLRPPTQMRMRTRSFCKSEENDFKKITSLSSASLPKSSSSNANKNTLIKTRSNDKEDKITEQNDKEKSRHKSIKYIQVKKQKEITADMRFKLVDWIIEVMNEFKLVHETLHCCVYLIDRSLEEIAIPTKKFHPLGCACLLMASKLVEVKHPRAADIAFFTNNICTVTDICKMELEIAQVLSFHLQFVTAFHFIGRFLNASHVVIRTSPSSSSSKGTSISSPTMKTVDMKLQHYPFCCDDDDDQGGNMNLLESSTEEDYGISEKDSNDMSHIKRYSYIMNNKLDAMALYFLDMSLLIPEFVDMKGSLVAAASVYIARAMVGIKDSEGNCWSEAMKYYTGYDVDYLAKAVTILHRYHNRNIKEESDGTNPKRRAIVKKYMHKDFLEVAKTPSILYEDLHLNSY